MAIFKMVLALAFSGKLRVSPFLVFLQVMKVSDTAILPSEVENLAFSSTSVKGELDS